MLRHRSLVGVLLLLAGCSSPTDAGDVTIADIHGLALDPNHPTRLYVATHHGLFVAENDTQWAAVTEQPFDMMGFTMHPADGRVMYASGHPNRIGQGWAVGVVKSTDAGKTWTTVALKNAVDFHAMAMEAAGGNDGDLVYGFHGGKVHASADGGRSWRSQPVAFSVAALATNPSSGDLYAATDEGLLRIGRNLSGTWKSVSELDAVAVASNADQIVSYFSDSGLVRSVDGGASWSSLNWTVPAGDYPWGVALDATESGRVYVGTATGSIHKTTDGGATWVRVR